MQSQYKTEKNRSIKQINDILIRDNRINFVGLNSGDTFYHLSTANGIEATIAIYDMNVPGAGIVAPLNIFGNPRDKDTTKQVLEIILNGALIEVAR